MNRESLYQPTGSLDRSRQTFVANMSSMAGREGKNRQIAGFLFSISAGIHGEIFPVYMGRNLYGSDMTCDICLREVSVNPIHGVILARKQFDQNGKEYINVVISDSDSDYGTSVNDNRVIGEKVICKTGDIITVGKHYSLQLTIPDLNHQLRVDPDFCRPSESLTKTKRLTLNLNDEITKSPRDQHTEDFDSENTDEWEEEATSEFYRPSKKPDKDHYNNETVIL